MNKCLNEQKDNRFFTKSNNNKRLNYNTKSKCGKMPKKSNPGHSSNVFITKKDNNFSKKDKNLSKKNKNVSSS